MDVIRDGVKVKVKQIFSDMDGSLLDDEGRVSNENIAAIKEAGLPFTLVSARAPMEMAEAIEVLELHSPQIAFNGGLVFQKEGKSWKVLAEAPIEQALSQQLVLDISKRYPEISLSVYTLEHWYAERVDAGVELEQNITGQLAELIDFEPEIRQIDKIFKLMMIIFDPQKLAEVKTYILSLGITEISVQQSGEAYLEITSKAAQKSQGIKYIMTQEGLKKADCAAFGDGHNDLAMFEAVAFPIAMANAVTELKDKASFVTKTNTEHGVAYGIKCFLLGDQMSY